MNQVVQYNEIYQIIPSKILFLFGICEVPRLGKLHQTLLAWVFAMGPRKSGQGRLQKPGGKHTPEMAKGEGIPSHVENTIIHKLNKYYIDSVTFFWQHLQ